MAGLTDEGLVIKTLPEIILEKQREIISLFGDTANVNPESNFGQLINVSAEREYTQWLLLEQIYLAQFPSTASKGSLDQTVSLNGVVRDGETNSIIEQQAFWGVPGTVVPAGTVLIVDGDLESKYSLNNDLTLGTGADQIQTLFFTSVPTIGTWSISFSGGVTVPETTEDLSFDASTADVKNALEQLTNIDGVTVTGDYALGFEITFDGTNVEKRINPILTIPGGGSLSSGLGAVTITPAITFAGVYQALGTVTALDSGPIPRANIYTLTEFESAVLDVDRTSNEIASTSGSARETDSELKTRRLNSLAAFGGGTADAIRAAILDIDDIFSVFVYENESIATVNGRPGKSFEVYVLQRSEIEGGAPLGLIDQQVGETIWQNKPVGIESFGSVPIDVTDIAGNPKVVYFSRPTGVPIYLTWELLVDPANFPVDGPTLIGNAVVEYGNLLNQGEDVIVYPYLVNVLADIVGIKDTTTKIGKTASPTSDANVVIDDGSGGAVEKSTWDANNVLFAINTGSIAFPNITNYVFNPTTLVWDAV